jgi:rhomboid-like protein
MNCLWPATRITCRTNINSKTCKTIDSVTQRLAQGTFRPYSISPAAYCRRDVQPSGTRLQKRDSSYNIWTGGLGLQYSKRFYGKRKSHDRIIRRYDDLPEGYDDQIGLEYRDEPVTKEEAHEIFSGLLDAKSADRLLRVLHGRRVAGSLPDPDEPSGLAHWEKLAQARGLAWLRETVPLDEDYNAVIRAELELAELEGKVTRKDLYPPSAAGYTGPKINLYKTNNTQGNGKNILYGESGLDAIRRREQERLDVLEEKAKKDEAQGVEHKTGTLEAVNTRSRVELRRPGENPRLKYYLERAKVLPDTPPDMTVFERLFPSGLVVLLTIGGVCTYAYFYTPPARADRLFPEIPPAFTTVVSIMLLNLAVFALWHHPPAFMYLNKYFLAVPGYPRALSMLGCMFSHQQFTHLLPNMLFLFFVGIRLHDEVGRANFIATYVGVGALASFVSLSSWVLRGSFITSTLGASGAIYGVIATYLWLHPTKEVRFFGSFPPDGVPGIPSWVLLAMCAIPDLLAVTGKRTVPLTMDHWAHLGGFGGGILAAEILKRTREKRRMLMMERRNKAMLARQMDR